MARPDDVRIAKLEILVDELIKDAPLESRIRTCMEAAGISYCKDPIERMNKVLAALDRLRLGDMTSDQEL